MAKKQSQAQKYGRTEADHGKSFDGGRWCHVCDNHHGDLYTCEHYPRWVLMEIRKQDAAYSENLVDRWKAGERSTELAVFMAFAGLEPE